MATYLETSETPYYDELWFSPIDNKPFWLRERSFPRSNRMVCLMEDLDGWCEYFVFPY